MPVKKHKPTSPGRRFSATSDYRDVTRKSPEKGLLAKMSKSGGRNNTGRTTSHWRGGGNKRRYRVIDFKRNKDGIEAKVVHIEYDPNRTSRIALLYYTDGEKRYIIAPNGIKVGDKLMSGPEADIRDGNCLPLMNIPLGSRIHNIEMQPGRGGQMVRSAGMFAQLMAKEGVYAQVRMPSGEVRLIHERCMATIGQVGNVDHGNINFGKAGRKRWMGIKPAVRGIAMDPNSHPHGGGEGRSGIGLKAPKTPWGKPALGKRTRRNKRTNTFIVRRRA